MFLMIHAKAATRIGVVGASIESKNLFEIAAQQAAATTGARIKLIWLAGAHSNHVDGRILVADSSAVSGRSKVEARVRLEGRSRADLPAIRDALVDVIQRLS